MRRTETVNPWAMVATTAVALGGMALAMLESYNVTDLFPVNRRPRPMSVRERFHYLEGLADENKNGALSEQEEETMYKRMGISERKFQKKVNTPFGGYEMCREEIEKGIESHEAKTGSD